MKKLTTAQMEALVDAVEEIAENDELSRPLAAALDKLNEGLRHKHQARQRKAQKEQTENGKDTQVRLTDARNRDDNPPAGKVGS